MTQKGDWSIPVTLELRKNMEEIFRAAYDNGCSLREDALILFEASRFPRAAALTILAKEEFSKAFILIISAGQGRWDSNLFKALRKHPEKQGMSEAMKGFLDWFTDCNKWRIKFNQSALIPISLSRYPEREKIEEFISRGKSCIKKPVKDFLKQECFYVGYDERAKMTCSPVSIGQNEAQSCLDETEKLKVIIELAMDDYKNRILRNL
jgi:AbiV family abortive infection protein